ncbi:hypothetical protein ACOMHN_054674 [Nucella lapillus]
MAGGNRRRNCFARLRGQKLMMTMIFLCTGSMWMALVERLRISSTLVTLPDVRDLVGRLPVDSGLGPLVPADSLMAKNPNTHIFFLNTHKAGGSIVRNMLLLFARRHSLTSLLPRPGIRFISLDGKNYWDNKAPGSEGRANDILSEYLVFNQTFVTSLMPPDTLYVGIVRDPFQQFLAAFQKYSRVLPEEENYLRAIPGPIPVATYLRDPQKWEHPDPSKSFTNNRMSFDFGLDVDKWGDKRAIHRYLQYLEDTFHLVMVADRFDESLVLLRRQAQWSLRDILYIQISDFEMLTRYTFKETQKQAHRKFQYPDYALYWRFEAILYKKIGQQIFYGFYSELARFRDTRNRVQVFCEKMPGDSIHIKASRWNEAFKVTVQDCKLMTGVLPLANHSLQAETYNYWYYKEEAQNLVK